MSIDNLSLFLSTSLWSNDVKRTDSDDDDDDDGDNDGNDDNDAIEIKSRQPSRIGSNTIKILVGNVLTSFKWFSMSF